MSTVTQTELRVHPASGPPPGAAVVQRSITTEDGWILDAETGEVLGRKDTPDLFRIDTDAKAEWALELKATIDGNLAGLEARVKALNEHMAKLIRREQARADWWELRYGNDLVEHCRTQIEGKRSKTWRCAFGAVSFRISKGTTKILDMARAVSWIRTVARAPELVETVERVAVSDVLKVVHGFDIENLPWLEQTGPRERATITTGVELPRPRGEAVTDGND